MSTFNAFVVTETAPEGQITEISFDNLSAGDTVIKVAYSSVNFKDSLAANPKGGVIRQYPMIPGIDISGIVEESADPALPKGTRVLVTGYGLGVSHTGGFAEFVRVPHEWVIPLPTDFSLKDAMIYGTAGLTAALSIEALLKQGLQKSSRVLVTGATGGVGRFAIQILKKLGVTAITALTRKDAAAYLTEIGASETVTPDSLFPEKTKPLGKQQFDFVVDTVGGDTAAKILPLIQYDGAMAMCGNAGGIRLETTVLPFILRGVALLGIDSVQISHEKRLAMWQHLATDWRPAELAENHLISLSDLPATFAALQAGKHIGRTVVEIGGD